MMISGKHVLVWSEISIRLTLFVIFCITEYAKPFHRAIHPDEWWLYKNPTTTSYVAPYHLWLLVATFPVIFFVIFSFRDKQDLVQAFLALTLCLCLNGVLTNSIKLMVGRPRPDFFYRCFPGGENSPIEILRDDVPCLGDPDTVTEGRKSFPSGHSSWSWSSLGLTAFYIAGKLHCFTARGRGQTWRFCLFILPLFVATMVALSRTADYHHHWQDVVVGSLIGLFLSHVCYRQYYPPLTSQTCDRPYTAQGQMPDSRSITRTYDDHIEPLSPVKMV